MPSLAPTSCSRADAAQPDATVTEKAASVTQQRPGNERDEAATSSRADHQPKQHLPAWIGRLLSGRGQEAKEKQTDE